MSDRLTIYAGRADPNDANRFTIPYMLNGQSGVIDCRLKDNGSIQMTVASGPATSAPPHWWIVAPSTTNPTR